MCNCTIQINPDWKHLWKWIGINPDWKLGNRYPKGCSVSTYLDEEQLSRMGFGKQKFEREHSLPYLIVTREIWEWATEKEMERIIMTKVIIWRSINWGFHDPADDQTLKYWLVDPTIITHYASNKQCFNDYSLSCWLSFFMSVSSDLSINDFNNVDHWNSKLILPYSSMAQVVTLCAYAQQGYVFGRISLCILYV